MKPITIEEQEAARRIRNAGNADPEHEDESRKRTPLVDPFIDHGNGAVSFSLPIAIANERELVAREAARADVALSTWIAQALRAHGPFADPKSEAERLVAIGETSDVDGAHIKLLKEQLVAEKARADSAEAKLAKVVGHVGEQYASTAEWLAEVSIYERRARRWEAFARHLWTNASKVEAHRLFASTCLSVVLRSKLGPSDAKRFREAREAWSKAINDERMALVHASIESWLAADDGSEWTPPLFDCGACGAYLGRATWCPCWHGSNRGKPGAGTLVKRSKGENR